MTPVKFLCRRNAVTVIGWALYVIACLTIFVFGMIELIEALS